MALVTCSSTHSTIVKFTLWDWQELFTSAPSTICLNGSGCGAVTAPPPAPVLRACSESVPMCGKWGVKATRGCHSGQSRLSREKKKMGRGESKLVGVPLCCSPGGKVLAPTWWEAKRTAESGEKSYIPLLPHFLSLEDLDLGMSSESRGQPAAGLNTVSVPSWYAAGPLLQSGKVRLDEGVRLIFILSPVFPSHFQMVTSFLKTETLAIKPWGVWFSIPKILSSPIAVTPKVTQFLQYDVKQHLPLLCHWCIINITSPFLSSPLQYTTNWNLWWISKESFLTISKKPYF